MADYVSEGGSLRCVFGERLDTVNCMSLEKELLEKIKEMKSPVVFDMEKVQYIASSFLRICFQVTKEVGAGNLSLIKVNPEIKKVLKIAGVDKYIKID
ncbi:MAG: STAS domain-containing protein [Candidatus Omnitrophota bacterium]|jgi:anti-anti-sigma factor